MQKEGFKQEETSLELLSSFHGFRIEVDSLKLIPENCRFELDGRCSLFDERKDGRSYDKRIVWSETWIANPNALHMDGKEWIVPVSYMIGKKRVEDDFVICTDQTRGIECHVGLMIDEDLHLHLFIGHEGNIRGHAIIKINRKADSGR